jgi:hypothetical protein
VISISDTDNSPELSASIAKLVQQVLRQSLFDITTSSLTPSTPLTRNTTPTLQLSRDESPALTPITADQPELHPLFRSENGIPDTTTNIAQHRVIFRDGDGQQQISRPIATTSATTPPSLLATQTQDTLRTNNTNNTTNNSPDALLSNTSTTQSGSAPARFAPFMPMQSQQPTTNPS